MKRAGQAAIVVAVMMAVATGVRTNAQSGSAALAAAGSSALRQTAYIKASNTGANDNFGAAVALGSAGDWLAVGAIGESSAATGLAGSQTDNSRDGVGAGDE